MDTDGFIRKYCVGKGVEIGGADNCVEGIDTLKVDRCENFSNKEYTVDHILEATDLSAFRDDQFDFVITIHVLEHITNPIKALVEWRRVVRDGGYIFAAIPKKSRTFDRYRPKTSLFHLLEDYRNDVGEGDPSHIDEWNELSAPCVLHDLNSPLAADEHAIHKTIRYYYGQTDLLEDPQVRPLWEALEFEKRRHRQLIADGELLDIHFHVWESRQDAEELLKVLHLKPVEIVDDYLGNSILVVIQVEKPDPAFDANLQELKQGRYPQWITREDNGLEAAYRERRGAAPSIQLPEHTNPAPTTPLWFRLANNLRAVGLQGTAKKIAARVLNYFTAAN